MEGVSAEEVFPGAFEGHVPGSTFERNMLSGEVRMRADRIILAHDVVRLMRMAAFVKSGQADPATYPPARIWGLDMSKIVAYLERVLGERFTTEFRFMTWSNTLNAQRVAVDGLPAEAIADIAPRMRRSLEVTLRATQASPDDHLAAWRNFQDILLVLGPIFAGEVTRESLSA